MAILLMAKILQWQISHSVQFFYIQMVQDFFYQQNEENILFGMATFQLAILVGMVLPESAQLWRPNCFPG